MMTAEEALEELKQGNRAYVADESESSQMGADSGGRMRAVRAQSPIAAILSCADSRVIPELIFNQGLGRLFVVRVAGNIADDSQVGSIEYAIEQLGVRLLVVVGHSNCGAVAAALSNATGLSPALSKVVATVNRVVSSLSEGSEKPTIDQVIEANVQKAIEDIAEKSPIIEEAAESGELMMLGAVYELETGQVRFLEPSRA